MLYFNCHVDRISVFVTGSGLLRLRASAIAFSISQCPRVCCRCKSEKRKCGEEKCCANTIDTNRNVAQMVEACDCPIR